MASVQILCLVCAITCTLAVTRDKDSQKLLTILFDGFRWDYVDKIDLPNFKRLIKNGARARYMKSAYPTLSYPNYYSLMTGLYTESHGMTGNYMYDEKRKEYFLIGSNPEQFHPHWWEGGEPLWITATKQQKPTYMFFWPGCEVTIHNTTAQYCKKFPPVPKVEYLRNNLAEGVQLLTNGTAEFVGVYHGQPDHVGHNFGPDSDELAAVMRNIDKEIGKLLDMLDAVSTGHKINLIVMSDHGMTYISRNKVINMTDILSSEPGLYETIMDRVSLASIYVKDGKKNRVYNILKDFHPNMTVYKKEDIPERFHYKNGKYVAEVTCVADLGWAILHPLKTQFPHTNEVDYAGDVRGFHGWDNEEVDMRGMFYAYGPYFKAGAEIDYSSAVDPYNIMCDILGIKPATNNGTRARLQPLLYFSGASEITSSRLVVVITTLLSFMLIVFGVFI